MQWSKCVLLALALILVPVISLPIGLESAVTEHESQDHSSAVAEEELKVVSVERYEPQSNFPVALSKKKLNLSPEDPTTKVPKAGNSKIVCLSERSNATSIESMTLEDLKRMINTVDLVYGTLPTHETYLTVDYGKRIFSSYDPIQAYYRLFDTVETNHLPKPSNIWMTQSPCLACAKRLIYEYGKQDSIKPTLRIASIYSGSGLLDTVDSLKCMAKMVHLNFTVLPWEWTEVKNNLDHADCIDSIDFALQDSGFNDKQVTLQKLIEFIHELSLNPEVSSWCKVFS